MTDESSAPPLALRRCLTVHALLSALGLVAVVLVWWLRDDLVSTWAEGGVGRRAAVAAGDVAPPAFVPVAVVLFVVLVALIWVLCAFVRLGFGWAQLTLSAVLAFMAVATVAGVRTGPPTTFEVLAVVSFVVEALALGLLWHPDTTAWVRGDRVAEQPAESGAHPS